MSLFDRYAKLKEAVADGHVHTGAKEILGFLKGRLSKADLPAVVVEPGGESEIRSCLTFAADKKMKVAVASGLKPTEVRDLEGQMLILTTRIARSPVFSASRHCLRVDAGLPAESLAVDLTRAGLRWAPLLPVPPKQSIGGLYALGWEGLRNWRDGGLLSHVRAIEWMGFDGRLYETGATVADTSPDVSGFLYGSQGSLGIITAMDLELQTSPAKRACALFEFPDVNIARDMLAELREAQALAETVIYWGETATRILRESTDNRVHPETVAMISVEWREDEIAWPIPWSNYGARCSEENAVASLWQDLFRFPRAVERLYPARAMARFRLSAEAIVDLEEACRDLGHDFSFPIALWGTLELGYLNVWVLQPDDQPRTTRRAEELLRKIYEVAANLGGKCAPGEILPFDTVLTSARTDGSLSDKIRRELQKRCDPNGMYVPLVKG